MVAGCGAKIAKFILFAINFCVWAAGIILIAVGAYAMAEASKFSYLFGEEDTLTTVAGLMVGVGVIIFIVGFCGCCGAVKQSTCLLKIYFALILLVIVLEFIAAIMAFVYQDTLTDIVTDQFTQAIEMDYNGQPKNVATETIDQVQMEFMCCGANGTADWAMSEYAVNNSVAVPPSCCMVETAECNAGQPGMPTKLSGLYEDGCVDAFTAWLKSNYVMIGGVCIGLLVFEVMALVITCCLIRAIDSDDKGL